VDEQEVARLIEEQIAYYRARAAEYDEWFMRRGRYDHGPELNRQWFHEVEAVARALAEFRPAGRLLELACGTGWWTEHLARYSDDVTAVDASPEAIALNRQRLGGRPVRYVEADLFAWEPDREYDVVFFSFWLSHVPPERFEPFWSLVRRCLAPGGRVFLIDSRPDPTSTARDQRFSPPDDPTMIRRLNDGRAFRIVKIYYDPASLAERLSALGWQPALRTTAHYFLYGAVTDRRRSGRD